MPRTVSDPAWVPADIHWNFLTQKIQPLFAKKHGRWRTDIEAVKAIKRSPKHWLVQQPEQFREWLDKKLDSVFTDCLPEVMQVQRGIATGAIVGNNADKSRAARLFLERFDEKFRPDSEASGPQRPLQIVIAQLDARREQYVPVKLEEVPTCGESSDSQPSLEEPASSPASTAPPQESSGNVPDRVIDSVIS